MCHCRIPVCVHNAARVVDVPEHSEVDWAAVAGVLLSVAYFSVWVVLWLFLAECDLTRIGRPTLAVVLAGTLFMSLLGWHATVRLLRGNLFRIARPQKRKR